MTMNNQEQRTEIRLRTHQYGGKRYYTDYITHMLRFFCKYPERPSPFRTDADRMNWLACRAVLFRLTEAEQAVIRGVYGRNAARVPDAVAAYCEESGKSPAYVYDLIGTVTEQVKTERRL